MSVATLPDFARRVTVVIALVALALFLWKIAPVLMLGFAGVVLAVGVRAAAEPLARRLRLSDTWAVGIVFALFVAFIVLGGYLFGKQIAAQTTELWDAIRQAGEKVQEKMGESPIGNWIVQNVQGGGGDTDAMAKVFKGTVTVFGGFADLILVLFLALYFAVDPATYRNGFLLLLPAAARERVGNALDASGRALRMWLMGQMLSMAAVGVLTAVGLWAAGVPMAIPLGVLAGLLDFVPFIGPLAAAIPGILVAFSQGPQVALYAALVYLAVQFAEGNVIMPMAQKWAVNLPPVLGLLAIVAFGLVFGFMGVLFAVPLAVVVHVLVQRLWVQDVR